MKTVIYLDELLLTNFLAAAALLLGAGLLCARQCSGLRLMAGSAAAAAASQPACPAPITITSYLNSIRSISFKTLQRY